MDNKDDYQVTIPPKRPRWTPIHIGAMMLSLFLLGSAGVVVFDKPAQSDTAVRSAQDIQDEARWLAMQATLSDIVNHYEAEVGIYIKDLKTGRTYEHRANDAFISASLIKLPIMVASFQAVWEGKIGLSTRIQMKRHDRRGGSGRLKWEHAGNSYPFSYLITMMMTRSDNTATAMVIDRLGYDYLNESFRKTGLVVTRINSTGMSLASTVNPAMDNYTTPREMGQLLEKLYRRQLVNDGLSDLMLEVMKGADGRSRLAQHLPSQWQLARKTGLLRKNCHDVGIVYTPQGDYIICVLTARNKTYEKAKGFIASVGKTAYNYLGHT